MIDKKGFEDWRELFKLEKKGKTPEEVMYRPVPEIAISPYFDQNESNNMAFPRSQSLFSHSFFIDSSSIEWLSKIAGLQESYSINLYFYDQVSTSVESISFPPIWSSDRLKAYHPVKKNTPLIVDFSKGDILPATKLSFGSLKRNNNEVWIHPGHDFLWNTALLRGINKYLTPMEISSISDQLSIYVLLQQTLYATDERQLIVLSNQLLAMMIGGLNHCIWDLRNATDWQKMNLRHLLNIPEILARESKIMINEDPIAGSDFFEELSNKVLAYLRE